MAKIELFTGTLPKSGSGRPARTPDADLYAAVLKVLQDTPVQTVDGEERPTIVGDPKRLFETAGKASSDGRIYAEPMTAELFGENSDKRVKVRTVESAPGSGKWGWVLYVGNRVERKEKNSAE